MRELKNVIIEITSNCNFNCQHCGNDSGKKRSNELEENEFYEIVDELHKLHVLRLGITGGEPLVHPKLFDYINYAKNKIPTISIATNGYFVDEAMIKKFKECNVNKFVVSLDGTSEFHNMFRGNNYAYQNAIKAIKLLVENGMEVKVRSVLTKDNQEIIINLIKITNELNIYRHEIIPMCPIGRADINKCLSAMEYYNFLKKSLELIRNMNCKIIYQFKPVFGAEELFTNIPSDCKEKSLKYRCDAFKTSLEITSTGDIIGCSFVRETVGNIRLDSIKNIWNSPKVLEIYKKIHYPLCKYDCDNKLCNGGCYANKIDDIEHYCFVKRR